MTTQPKSLTDAFIRGLKPIPGKRIVIRDKGREGERGLEVRVTPNGIKTWSLRYYRPADGKRVRLKLGTFPALGVAAARVECREARYNLDKRNDPSIAREKRKGADTFKALAQQYLDRYAKGKKSRAETERILKREWYPVIGSMRAGEVNRRTLSEHLESIAHDRDAPVAANRALAAVRQVYRWALSTGRLEAIPVYGLKKPAAETARKRSLSHDEIRAFWTGLPDTEMDGELKEIIRLCLILGQRVGEVAGMLKEEIDSAGKMWLLPGERTKNGQPHAIPLSDMALAIIKPRLKGKGRYVFPGRYTDKASILASAPNKALQRNLDTLGIAHFTIHDLRRTVNTELSKLKIDVQTRARVLNHVSTRKASVTEGVYNAHEFEPEKRHALQTWETMLSRIIQGGKPNVIEMRRS